MAITRQADHASRAVTACEHRVKYTCLAVALMSALCSQKAAAESCDFRGPLVESLKMSGCLGTASDVSYVFAVAGQENRKAFAEQARPLLGVAPAHHMRYQIRTAFADPVDGDSDSSRHGSSGPVIEKLIAEVLSAHPSVQAQNALLAAAQSGVDAARWQFFPTPGVSVEHASSGADDLSYRGDSTVTVLRLQQPIWTGGRLTAGLEKAQANASIAESSREDARQQLAMRVVQNYGDWLAAHLKSMAWGKSLEVHETLQQHVRRRIAAGVAAESDSRLSEGRILAIRADISAVTAQHDTALSRLSELLGRNLGEGDELSRRDAQLPAASYNLQVLLQQAESTVPALKKATFQIGAAEAEVEERRAELLPEIYLRYESQRGNFSNSLSGLENRLFVGLSSRFGAGLSSMSGISAAGARRDAARDEREAILRELRSQVMADHAALLSVQRRMVSLKDSLSSARDVSDSYFRQFLAGKRSWLDVMNSAREVAQIEVQLGDARGAQVVLAWRLHILARGVPPAEGVADAIGHGESRI